jgi:hypothetical protein
METLVMDQRIVWDSSSLKQIDEAKATIMKYKRMGYEILLSSGAKMDKWSPSYEEVIVKAAKVLKRTMKILSQSGDDRIVWDCDNGYEAMEAKKKFQELLSKGYTAYSVDVNGQKNRKITEFDVEAEEILMVPKTAKG